MKVLLSLITFVLSVCSVGLGQTKPPNPAKLSSRAPCVSRQITKLKKRAVVPSVVPVPIEPTAEIFVGEAMVEVKKDQTVVRLAMAQHASVLIELPANDGPRYIIPGDPEMVTVDEKALERNKRAIIVRPGSLFVVPFAGQKTRAPAATVTAQMRSGLVVTFLFYPVADLAQNVHRCVLHYQRDEVVARRRAAGLPVNLDQKEGGEKSAGQTPGSISVDPINEVKAIDAHPANKSSVNSSENTSNPAEITPNITPISNSKPTSLASESTNLNDRVVAAATRQLARAKTGPGLFKNWTRPLHDLALSVVQGDDLKGDFRVLLLAVKNSGAQPLKLIPGTPDLTLEMHDDKGKVINVQSLKPLHIETSDLGNELAARRTIYYAIAYVPPPMGVRQRLQIVVAQTNAADEPVSIALVK